MVPGIASKMHSWAVRSGADRATRYREQAERLQLLAKMEAQPRARARLLELADEYQQLADAEPPKPSASWFNIRDGSE